MPELKIGTTIDIVFENAIDKNKARHMKALVYDYEDKNIVISQTSPPLNHQFLKRRILVTFLTNVEKHITRFGFSAKIMDLITNYQIAHNKNIEALVLAQYGKPSLADFRMYFRLRPPSQSNIDLFFKDEKVTLIDISIGGAKYIYPKSRSFFYGDEVNFKLIIDSMVFNLKARVRNISPPHDFSPNQTVQYVGVEFNHDNKQLDTVLGRAIIDIERQLLSEGKIS
jgi:hypothetical protein